MPHYIRFLKPPRLATTTTTRKHASRYSVSALVTITTDLGDSFLAEDVELTATLSSSTKQIARQNILWSASLRQLPISFEAITLDPDNSVVQLAVGPANQTAAHAAAADKLTTAVLSACSAPFGGSHGPQADKLVLRRLETHRARLELRIWEETGNSIARHIWDASIACLALYEAILVDRDTTTTTTIDGLRQLLLRSNNNEQSLNVLELGSGCGIAGIGLAQLLPHTSVLLTDLEEVRDIIDRNIDSANPAEGSSLRFDVLNWDESVPEQIGTSRYDLILVSDCTYNSDSLPALIRTLASLLQQSPEAGVVVSLKRRHESEGVFFELMQQAGMEVCGRYNVPLPCIGHDGDIGDGVVVEMYYFRLEA